MNEQVHFFFNPKLSISVYTSACRSTITQGKLCGSACEEEIGKWRFTPHEHVLWDTSRLLFRSKITQTLAVHLHEYKHVLS